jgi:hypothetical protein
MSGYREDLADAAASRYAAEWGLASLLLGGVLTIIAPVMLIFNLMFWVSGPTVVTRDEMRVALGAAVVLLGVIGVLGLLSVRFGFKGLGAARAYGQPAALPVAGILVSLLALLLWAAVGGDLVAILVAFSG